MEYPKAILRESSSNTSDLKYGKTGNAANSKQMRKEMDSFKINHNQVKTGKKAKDENLATYVAECKTLNENLYELKKSHDCNASTSAKLLQEVTCHNKKLMSIQVELEGNLDRKMKEIETANKNWSRKFQSLEQKNLRNEEEIIELKKMIEEKRSSEKNFVDSERQLTALIQEMKNNECKAKSETETWKKSMSTLKASHEKEIASLQRTNSNLVMQLGLASQEKAAYRDAKEIECELHNVEKKLDMIAKEKKILQDQSNHLQKQLTAAERKAKLNESNAKLEVESLRNALRELKASHKEATSLLQKTNSDLVMQLGLATQEKVAYRDAKEIECELHNVEKKLDMVAKEKKILQDQSNHLQKQLTAMEQKVKLNENNAKLEVESLRNALRELKASHKEATSLLQIKNNELADKLALVSQQRDEATAKVSGVKYESQKTSHELQTITKEKENLERRFNHLQNQFTAKVQEAKQSEAKAELEVKSSKNAISKFEASFKESIGMLRIENQELTAKLTLVSQQKDEACSRVTNAQSEIRRKVEELENLTKEKETLEHQLNRLQNQLTVVVQEAKQNEASAEMEIESSRNALTNFETSYTEAIGLLRSKNQELTEKLAAVSQQRDEAFSKVTDAECESQRTSEELQTLAKAVTTMKATCNMQDEQIDDLEGLNKQLGFDNEQLLMDKQSAQSKIKSLQEELCACKNLAVIKNAEIFKMKKDTDEVIDLRQKLMEKTSIEQEVADQLVTLERKYKLQEMHVDMLQKKLHDKKSDFDRLKIVSDSYEKRIGMLESVHGHASAKLTQQRKQLDVLAYEKTRLLNEVDDMKMNYSHEAIRFNSTIGQQSKLIDFLQARIESSEHHDKKKKRRKIGDLYQVPLQYKELQEMLEESKQVNLQLQAKVNGLRTELQTALSEVSELKHGLPSIDYLASGETGTSIPAFKMSTTSLAPFQSDFKGLHHRFAKNICTHSTQCPACLDCVRFGSRALQCSQCNSWYHVNCKDNANDNCSKSVGQAPHLKYKSKEVAPSSPMSCVAVTEEGGDLQSWLKVLCDGQSWKRKYVQLQDGALIIHKCEKTVLNLFKLTNRSSDTEGRVSVDLLQQQYYIHATVSSSELTATDCTDHLLVFKLELSSGPFLHTSGKMYFMTSNISDKRKWVTALQKFSTSGLSLDKAVSNHKIFGNKIVTLEAKDKLKMNCSLPISKGKVLLGCDEGLYVLNPSSSFVCNRSHIDAVKGADQILQMELLGQSNLIVAIEGKTKRLVSFDMAHFTTKTNLNVQLCFIDNLVNCHLFAVGSVEGDPNICAATASRVHIYRFNKESTRFEKKQDILVAEPCTCLQFTLCSVILGTNKFLEIELTNFKLDDFLNESGQSLHLGTDALPVDMIEIDETNGIYEYLLCYHEYGVFVDCFGSRTRKENIRWSRLPVSFAYRKPHLMIMQQSSIEIMLIHPIHDSKQRMATHQVYIDLPNPRFLGSAITDNAVYVSDDDSDKVSVYCCKGLVESAIDKGKPVENQCREKKIISSSTIDEGNSDLSEYSEYSEVSSPSIISSAYSPRKRK